MLKDGATEQQQLRNTEAEVVVTDVENPGRRVRMESAKVDAVT